MAVRHDLSRGMKKEEVLKSLSQVISSDLFNRVQKEL